MKKLLTAMLSIVALLFIVLQFTTCKNNSDAVKNLTDEEIVDIATKAYVYGYPLILMDLTQKVATNVEAPTDNGYAPLNQMGHYRSFPDDKFTAVVKPNVDTYYSISWLDLKQEPIVLSVPATDRYYLLPMLDAYTNVFSVPGPRTTGTDAENFLISGPFWNGDTPEGMTLIQSPTNLVWIVGRTQVNSKEDGATVVKAIQDGYKLVPLNSFGKAYTAPKGVVNEANKSIVPVKDIEAMSISTFFNELAALMVNNPPLEGDEAIINDIAKIGIVAGETFGMDGFSDAVKTKLEAIPNAVDKNFKSIIASSDPSTLVNGWAKSYQLPNMGNYGTDYDFRALIAYVGLGANLPQDAVYPNTALDGDGNLLDSDSKYVLHFEKEQIPPVNAFWSLTVYNDHNFLAENPINRFALGDRDDLTFNKDGSLDIYIQRENPGKAKYSNWLPAPAKGNFELTLRLYWPKEEVMNKTWVPPAVKIVK
jgi:hypothetical protein